MSRSTRANTKESNSAPQASSESTSSQASQSDSGSTTAVADYDGGLPEIVDDVPDESVPDDWKPTTHDYGDPDDGDDGEDGIAPPAAAASATPAPAAKGAAAAPAAPASAFDADLVTEATAYGFDPANFTDEKSLRAAVVAFDKQIATWGREAIAAEGQQPGTPAAPAATAPPPVKPAAPQAKVTEVLPPAGAPVRPDFEKLAQYHDPDFIEVLKQLDAFHDQRFAAMEKQFQAVQERYRQADEVETEQRLDAFFDGLGEEFAPIFGKGAGRELKPESPELKERGKILDAADVLLAGYASRGQTPPAEPVLLKKALQLVHSDKLEQLATSRISTKVRGRQQQFAARPTQRLGTPLSKEQQAIQNIAASMRRMGVEVADDDEGDDGPGDY